MEKQKIHNKLLLFALLFLPLNACNDWLELTPPDGLVKDEFWKTKEDVEALLMGAYQSFANMDEKLFLFGELRGDMIITDNNTNWNERSIKEGNIYPTNSMCNWQDFYQVISYCNQVLKYAPIIQDPEIDPTFTEIQKQGFEAEAVFLRSLAYFYLVRIYKDVPLVVETTESDDADFFLAKSADSTIMEF